MYVCLCILKFKEANKRVVGFALDLKQRYQMQRVGTMFFLHDESHNLSFNYKLVKEDRLVL